MSKEFSEYAEPECKLSTELGQTCASRTWDSEHPGAKVDVSLIPEGFLDDSWHNDACPSFRHPTYNLKLWYDYETVEERESENQFRFALVYEDEYGYSAVCFKESNSMDEIKAAINYFDIEAYHRQLGFFTGNPQAVVNMMDSIAARIRGTQYFERSYDEVALDLAELRGLYISAGEKWEHLMEKDLNK